MTKITGFVTNEPNIERYTPPEVAIAVRDTLGSIDLDPASTPLVNQVFLRAKHIYTKENNGLNRELPWRGKMFVNPPGGDQNPRFFWERLIIEHANGNIPAGVFLAFNIEFLQQSQNWTYPMVQYPFCIPSRRLIWYEERSGQILPMKYNGGTASAIIYVGKNIQRFAKAFSNIGAVIIPRNTK